MGDACAVRYSIPVTSGLLGAPGQRQSSAAGANLGRVAGPAFTPQRRARLPPTASHAFLRLSFGCQPTPSPRASRLLPETAAVTACKARAEARQFLPKLSPPLRWEPARSVTQVASFPLNNGVPCDECLNSTPRPLLWRFQETSPIFLS